MFGALGDRFVTAAIAISTFGFLDLAILAPTRVYYAMAADRVFLPALSRLHPTYQTPWIAILIQSTWSCVLALTGRYEQLLNYVVFADWIFFGLTVATVIVFRRTHPLSQRPPGTFPRAGLSAACQIAFVVVAAAVVLSVVRADPSSAWRGAVLLAAGHSGVLLVHAAALARRVVSRAFTAVREDAEDIGSSQRLLCALCVSAVKGFCE